MRAGRVMAVMGMAMCMAVVVTEAMVVIMGMRMRHGAGTDAAAKRPMKTGRQTAPRPAIYVTL